MAISRKRKQPSAGSDPDLEEGHHEDGRPSKKTATSKYNIQSAEGLPLPTCGPVPVIVMILYFGEQEQTVRALLDTGSTVPLLSLSMVEQHQISLAERETNRTIQDYTGQEVPGAGEFFTSPLLLQHRHHYSRLSFEVAPLAGDYDIIIPRWWLAKHKCDLLASNGRIRFTSGECQRKCTKERNDTAFSLERDPSVLENPEAGILGMVAAAPSSEDLKAAINKVPEAYSEFIPIMTAEMAEVLPEHSEYDHAIDLKEGTTPPWGPINPLNEVELEELRNWLKKMTEMGVVRQSKSACSSPMLFVPKGHGRGLRLCIDYRGINKITVPNRYPLPNMDELKEQVRGVKWFNKIDLKNGYHLIRIKEGDEWKTAFRCRYGLFEYTVMSFGLVNAPATFQGMINNIFRDMLDQGMSAFMDDLIMWSDTRSGLDKITLEVLRRLKDNRLCIAPDKCEWAQHQIEFLRYMVSGEGVEMTDEKVETLKKIEPVNSLKDTQHLLGFANFYRRFIKDYSKIILPITNSTSLAANQWRTSPEIEQAQQKLVTAFTTSPVLRHFDPGEPAIVETDASDFALGGILSQQHEGRLHPIAFHSRKFTEAEINYDTADKELLAIVDCFKRWR